MKRSVILSVICLLFIACDKVEKPFVNYVPPKKPQRKVLLEDYTGHQCGNCPLAAQKIQQFEKQYGEDLVVVSIHAGYFANTDAEYTTSYTTTPGNEWNMYYIGLAGAYPAGAVNRKNYGQQIIEYSLGKWPTMVSAGFNDEYIMDLTVYPTFDSESRKLNVTVKGKFLRDYSKNLKITVLLTEDSLISKQKDYSPKNGIGYVEDYKHMHMLRDAINGSWGTPFTTDPMAAGDSISVSFSDFLVNPDFKSKKMSVVAFAFNAETREVIEAEKVRMTTN